MSEQNKAAARVAFEVWGGGELDRLDEFVAPDVLHHDPYDQHAAEGLGGMKETIKANRRLYPDLQVTVDDQIAEGDRVATRWTATMTREGPEGGATGGRAILTGITIDRFEDGKIVEAWRSMDMLGLLRSTGALPE